MHEMVQSIYQPIQHVHLGMDIDDLEKTHSNSMHRYKNMDSKDQTVYKDMFSKCYGKRDLDWSAQMCICWPHAWVDFDENKKFMEWIK